MKIKHVVTKRYFIRDIARDCKMPIVVVRMIVDAALRILTSYLSNGCSVRFVGFGTFYVGIKREHMGYHPSDFEIRKKRKVRVVYFKTGRKLKRMVRNTKGRKCKKYKKRKKWHYIKY